MAITVGRSAECDLQVFHESVSRVHLKLVNTLHGIEVHDCGSSAGTWVKGQRVQRAVVQPGDEVKLANLITLDWENPVIRDFLAGIEGESKPGSSVKKPRSNAWFKVGIPVAATFIVVAVLFFTGVFGTPEGRVASRSVTLSRGSESVVGISRIRVTIPAGATNSSATIEVNPVEMGEDYSTENVQFASDVYSFTDPGVVFDQPITIELAFDPSMVSQGSIPFPAYLKDTIWVQVSGQLEDSVFFIESNHLSTWAVLYDDALRWQRSSNPLIASLHEACQAVFTVEDDKWEMVSDYWETIESNTDFYLGNLPESFEGMFCQGNTPSDNDYLTTVHASGNINEVYYTNLPAYISASNYSSTSDQLAAWCFHGEEWISTPETVFKCLYTVKCREALENMDREQVASELEEAADDLSRMHFWHAAGSGVDMLQTVLSEVLAHGSTGVPPSPFELVDVRTLHAIEGIICRVEMERLRDELLQLANDLRSWQEEGHYSFDTPIISRLENAYTKIDAVAELSRATFPAFEENWFSYTASKVLTDFMTLFIQREAAHFAQVSSQAVDFQSALYSARLSSLLSIASDAQTAVGVFQIICHAINASGDNPLYNYYEAINRSDYEIVDSFTTLVETAYVLAMLEQVEDDRFMVAADGVIHDTITGKYWFVGEAGLDWYEATESVRNLTIGDMSWRLPSIEELTELSELGIDPHQPGPFNSEGSWVWTSANLDGDQAEFFVFPSGVSSTINGEESWLGRGDRGPFLLAVAS